MEISEIKELTAALCGINAVSGVEGGNGDELCKILMPYFDDYKALPCNSYLFIKHGREGGKKILLDAHFDQIGMVVSSIGDDGFISISPNGGMDIRNLISSKVTVHADCNINGVILYAKPDLLPLKRSEMVVDTGESKEKLISLGVTIGTPITLSTPAVELLNGKYSSRSLDDRICGVSIVAAVSMLKSDDFSGEIDFLFSSQEESFGAGALTGAYTVNPDLALAVDVDFASTPEADKKDTATMGKGPTLSVSTHTDRKLTAKIEEIAEKNEIPIQRMLCPKGTGTNAGHILIARDGIPTAVLGIAITNMHTGRETVDFGDVRFTARLIAEFIKSESGGNV